MEIERPRGSPVRPIVRWGVTIPLLWLFFAQALVAARAASLIFDEGTHLAVGYATLRTRDLRLQPVHIHPPLTNVLAAAPLLLDPDLPNPREIPGWEISSLSAITDGLVWRYPHPDRLALAGRLPIILMALLTAALVFRWAADRGGGTAGSLALLLFVLDPNLLAHGSLVTTDMGVTLFGFATFFLLHRFLRHPSRVRLAAVGVALGLALASKVSAALLLLVVGGPLLLEYGRRARRARSPRDRTVGKGAPAWRQGLRSWLAITLVALGVLWAVYGFELRPVPEVSGSLPLPAATHLQVYRSLQEHYRTGHPAFLAGQVRDQGWWVYFPVAFGIKTPLPTLILLGVALALSLRRWRAAEPALFLFPIIHFVTALFSSVDIGYRHLLPILPFLFVFIGSQLGDLGLFQPNDGTAPGEARHEHTGRLGTALSSLLVFALLLWLALGTLAVHPYPLAFFNELVGGPAGGYRWLVDSNLDWGQNLWGLRHWMEDASVERVYYSHFSPARPAAYGVVVDWLPPDPRAVPYAPLKPAPGVYAIGATTLQGVYTPDVNTFAYFRTRRPDAVLGHALFIYRVVEDLPVGWAAVCYDLPLDAPQIRQGLSQPDLRLIYFDCDSSLVYGQGAGRLLMSPGVDEPPGATLQLQARRADGDPDYRVFGAARAPAPSRAPNAGVVDGPLDFLGFDLDATAIRPGQTLLLRTYWKVREPASRPLSLMAHLVGPDGVPIAVGDGLGVPLDQWRTGDLIVQVHPLVIPEAAPAGDYAVHSGAYWLEDLERWPIRRADGTLDDHLFLDKITILD
jgi:hypothetical protein